jgi:hypothetical protein
MFTRWDLAFSDGALPVRFGIGEWGLFMNDHKHSTIQSKYSLRTLCYSASILFNIHLLDFFVLLNITNLRMEAAGFKTSLLIYHSVWRHTS